MAVTTYIIFAGLLAVVFGEVAVTTTCDDVDQTKCAVGEVRINPCDTIKYSFCLLKKGKQAHMEFDFTPNFTTTNLTTGVYWPNKGVDMPFSGLASDDACLLTTCPTVAGQQQVLSYDLHVGTKLPTGRFQFKWKVWNAENVEDVCCFKTFIKLKK